MQRSARGTGSKARGGASASATPARAAATSRAAPKPASSSSSSAAAAGSASAAGEPVIAAAPVREPRRRAGSLTHESSSGMVADPTALALIAASENAKKLKTPVADLKEVVSELKGILEFTKIEKNVAKALGLVSQLLVQYQTAAGKTWLAANTTEVVAETKTLTTIQNELERYFRLIQLAAKSTSRTKDETAEENATLHLQIKDLEAHVEALEAVRAESLPKEDHEAYVAILQQKHKEEIVALTAKHEGAVKDLEAQVKKLKKDIKALKEKEMEQKLVALQGQNEVRQQIAALELKHAQNMAQLQAQHATDLQRVRDEQLKSEQERNDKMITLTSEVRQSLGGFTTFMRESLSGNATIGAPSARLSTTPAAAAPRGSMWATAASKSAAAPAVSASSSASAAVPVELVAPGADLKTIPFTNPNKKVFQALILAYSAAADEQQKTDMVNLMKFIFENPLCSVQEIENQHVNATYSIEVSGKALKEHFHDLKSHASNKESVFQNFEKSLNNSTNKYKGHTELYVEYKAAQLLHGKAREKFTTGNAELDERLKSAIDFDALQQRHAASLPSTPAHSSSTASLAGGRR